MFSAARDYFVQTDKLLLLLCWLASAYGLALLYTATYSYQTDQYMRIQLIAIGIGTAGYLLATALDIRRLARCWPLLFLLELLLLGSLYFWGVGDGNRSWIRFSGIGIQPAELGKLLFIVSFSGHLTDAGEKGMRLRDMLALTAHAGSVCLFVLWFSRDDGMTLEFLFLALYLAFTAGLRFSFLAASGVLCVGALPMVWTFFLDKYQKERILAVFEPQHYPDTAYQAMQTTRAIAMGGLRGRGFLQGSRTQYSLIPTKHTDSIIAVAGEELGFLGCAAVILLLALIIARCVSAALRTRDATSGRIAAGIAGILVFQTVLNLGMNLGVLPVVGLTLPFFSYGGTSVVTMYAAMGIVGGMRRTERREKKKNQADGGYL